MNAAFLDFILGAEAPPESFGAAPSLSNAGCAHPAGLLRNPRSRRGTARVPSTSKRRKPDSAAERPFACCGATRRSRQSPKADNGDRSIVKAPTCDGTMPEPGYDSKRQDERREAVRPQLRVPRGTVFRGPAQSSERRADGGRRKIAQRKRLCPDSFSRAEFAVGASPTQGGLTARRRIPGTEFWKFVHGKLLRSASVRRCDNLIDP